MYIDPTPEAARAFFSSAEEGPVVMLNLLRFREYADYSAAPKLAPDEPITGARAYRRYMAHAAPFVEAAGGEVLFSGTGGANLIGPSDERWDHVLLVRYPSANAFRKFTSDPGYLAGLGHRSAALADSRLLPLTAG